MADKEQTGKQAEHLLMAYEDSADRVPVLWIHGFPLSSLLWDFQVEGLADVARLITPDLRGHGLTEPTDPPYSMEVFADDCARLLDHLGIEGPVVIGGLSMGGYVAFEFCRRYPERVAGLILAATRAEADPPEVRAIRDQTADTAIAEGVEPIAAAMLPRLLAPAAYKKHPELVVFVRDMMWATSTDGVVGASAAMRDRPDSTPDLARLDIPVLVIHGAEDQMIPVAAAESMTAALPQAELVVIPGAGHLPNLEQPEIFNNAVLGFLEQFYEG